MAVNSKFLFAEASNFSHCTIIACLGSPGRMPGSDAEERGAGVLVIGDSQVGKASLLRKLPGAAVAPDTSRGRLELNTKYYTASTTIACAGGSHPPLSGSEAPEAVVLVFDCTREASFEFVKACARPGDGLAAAEIRLCVATKIDRIAQDDVVQRPDWLEGAKMWCSEELMEYVEAAPENPAVDRALTLDGERQGVRRIISALEAFMWPGLVRKSGQGTTASNGPCVGKNAAADGPSSSSAGLAASDSLASDAEACRGEAADAACSEEELEKEMESFEKLLGDVAGARGRLQDLPDAERRTAAESLTLTLLARLGLDDDPASDSESS